MTPEENKKVAEELVAFAKEAKPVLTKLAAQEDELSKLAPTVVDSLIKAGELDEQHRDQAIKNVINDPVKVAQCLESTAAALVEKKQEQAAPATMGSGAEINKTAGVEEGAPTRSKADAAFLGHLGLG
jgi:hypothetical protein